MDEFRYDGGMGQLLPDRHPNRDFFILDVADASPKDEMASMEHPVYSLSAKPDMRELKYNVGEGTRLRIVPSGYGLATIMDKDILLFCISKLVHSINSGEEVDGWVEFTAHEVMVATNWRTNKTSYDRFEQALLRLRGTTIVTDIRTGGATQTNGFGLIEEFEITKLDDNGEVAPFGRRSKVRVKVSDWTFRAVKGMEVLTLNRDYFRLRRPLERRLYEIALKHCGQQERVFKIGRAKLQAKVGSNSPPKKFRYFLREIIGAGNIPDFEMWMIDDIVHFRRRNLRRKIGGKIKLKAKTMDLAQVIAAEKGLDLHAMLEQWQEFARKKGAPNNPDGAFIGFLKARKSERQTSFFD